MAFKTTIRGAAPALSISDHQCLDCKHQWELTLSTREAHAEKHMCPQCESDATIDTDGCATAPVTIVRGNSDFGPRQHERLYKRSSEHYRKEGRDEAVERDRKELKKARSVVGE